MADTILYDPNTGRKLNPGESVVDKATGKTVTQGTSFSATQTPTVSSSSNIPSTTNLTETQRSGLQTIQNELLARIAAGTPANQARIPEGTTNVSGLGAGETPNTTKVTPKIETTTPETSTGYYQAQLDALQKQRDELEASMKENLKTESTGYAGLVEALNNQPALNIEQKRKDEETLAGIKEMQDKLTYGLEEANALKVELQTIEDLRLAETEQARTRLTSMENISSDIDAINYKFDLQKAKKNAALNTKLFELDVINGNITNAQNRINQIVEDYTADKKAEVDKFDKLFTVYSSWISDLSADEKQILENAHTESINALAQAKEDTNNVLNLKLNYPNAGILVSDSVEEATKKAAEYDAKHPKIAQTVGSAETGYTMYDAYGNVIGTKAGTGTGFDNIKLTDTQLMSGAAKARMTINDFNNLPIDEQSWYITGRYENALDTLANTAVVYGLDQASYAISNDSTIPENIKTNLRKDLNSTLDAAISNQTKVIKSSPTDISLYDEDAGKEDKISTLVKDMDTVAKNLKYGSGTLFFMGDNVNALYDAIDNYVENERAKKRLDSEIFKDIKGYLLDAQNNEVSADNPLIKY